MRWSYVIPRMVIILVVWGFFAFGFDPLLRSSAVSTAQSVTGAKADVAGLTTGFFPPQLEISQVDLASRRHPGTNLVSFERLTLKLGGEALLHRNFVIEEASLTGVRFGTSRADNGQLELVEEEDPGPTIPPWLQDRLRQHGDEWLDDITARTKEKLDPNTLETYRVGNELYTKWDKEFDETNLAIESAKLQYEQIRRNIEAAKDRRPFDQVEIWLQAVRDADSLAKRSQVLLTEFRTRIPRELQSDFGRLNQAQQNDREMIRHSVQLLKPDARRISESLLGDEMYLQLQQLLSWIELARDYQQELKQPESVRHRGIDFEFPLTHPTPRVLCRKMQISGELSQQGAIVPFSAVLTNVTSDPQLLGKPAELHVTTSGKTPVRVVVRHDATEDIPVTRLAFEFTDQSAKTLTAGRPHSHQLTAGLKGMHWSGGLTMTEGQLNGHVQIRSEFQQPQLEIRHRLVAGLGDIVEHSLGEIEQVTARLRIAGKATAPTIDLESDLGDQISDSFSNAYAKFVPVVQEQLATEVNSYVEKQKKKFVDQYGGRFKGLLADQEKLLASINEAKMIAAKLRTGQLDPNRVFRLASDTGVLKGKDQEKAEKYLNQGQRVLDGIRNPQDALMDSLPGLKNKLFRR